MARFVVFHNDKPVKSYNLDDPVITIGRLSENSITLPSMGISRRHARIERDADGILVLTDLSSLNGTYLNNEKISRSTVSPGDVITIGAYSIELKAEGSETIRTEEMPEELEEMHREMVETQSIQPPSSAPVSKSPAQSTAVLIETNRHIVYKIDRPVLTFGPLPDNDIFIPDRLVGKDSISVTADGTDTWIESKGLLSRLKINGTKTNRHKLEHKDRIEIGKYVFRYMENN